MYFYIHRLLFLSHSLSLSLSLSLSHSLSLFLFYPLSIYIYKYIYIYSRNCAQRKIILVYTTPKFNPRLLFMVKFITWQFLLLFFDQESVDFSITPLILVSKQHLPGAYGCGINNQCRLADHHYCARDADSHYTLISVWAALSWC